VTDSFNVERVLIRAQRSAGRGPTRSRSISSTTSLRAALTRPLPQHQWILRIFSTTRDRAAHRQSSRNISANIRFEAVAACHQSTTSSISPRSGPRHDARSRSASNNPRPNPGRRSRRRAGPPGQDNIIPWSCVRRSTSALPSRRRRSDRNPFQPLSNAPSASRPPPRARAVCSGRRAAPRTSVVFHTVPITPRISIRTRINDKVFLTGSNRDPHGTHHRGVGSELSIVLSFVELHHARAIDSFPGHGNNRCMQTSRSPPIRPRMPLIARENHGVPTIRLNPPPGLRWVLANYRATHRLAADVATSGIP